MELDLAELKTRFQDQRERQQRDAQTAERLHADLAESRRRLQDEVVPQLENAEKRAADIESSFSAKQATLEIERSRRRWQQHEAAEEREEAMKRELEPMQKDVDGKQSILQGIQQQLQAAIVDSEALEQSVQQKHQQKEELSNRQSQLRSELAGIRSSLEQVLADRKQLWRENETLNGEIEKESAAIEAERRELNRLVLINRFIECKAACRHASQYGRDPVDSEPRSLWDFRSCCRSFSPIAREIRNCSGEHCRTSLVSYRGARRYCGSADRGVLQRTTAWTNHRVTCRADASNDPRTGVSERQSMLSAASLH